MEYARTAFLFSLLINIDEVTAKTALRERFSQLMEMTFEYKAMTVLLESTDFLGPEGHSFKKRCETTLINLTNDIDNPAANIDDANELIKIIELGVGKTNYLLDLPAFFDDELTMVSTFSKEIFTEFYRAMANAICYTLVCLNGLQSISRLTYNHHADFLSLAKLVNGKYAQELYKETGPEKPAVWCISKANFSGIINEISHEGYVIEYIDTDPVQFMDNKGIDYCRIAPFIYAAKTVKNDIIIAGIGNIVGVRPDEGVSLLGAEVIPELPIDIFHGDIIDFTHPMETIRKALGTDMFCIAPENLVTALNRYQMVQTIRERKRKSLCIICGGNIEKDRRICQHHFKVSE